MRISDEELAHLESLARIELEDEEREAVRSDLSRVLEYFDSLNELDTEGVEELVHPVPLVNVLREDEPRASLRQDVALGMAVESEDGFFKVPRTVDDDTP